MTEAILNAAGTPINLTIGWRKSVAWLLVFGLCVYATVDAMSTGAAPATDIPPNVVELMKWVTGFFFGSNVAEHFIRSNTTIKVGGA